MLHCQHELLSRAGVVWPSNPKPWLSWAAVLHRQKRLLAGRHLPGRRSFLSSLDSSANFSKLQVQAAQGGRYRVLECGPDLRPQWPWQHLVRAIGCLIDPTSVRDRQPLNPMPSGEPSNP